MRRVMVDYYSPGIDLAEVVQIRVDGYLWVARVRLTR
jgi:hypothetical protein